MADKPIAQAITSGSEQRKNVPVVTVESFYQGAWREAAAETGGKAGRISPENPRADHQPPRPRALRFLQLFRGKARPGARRGRAIVSEESVAPEDAHPAFSRLVCAKNSVPGHFARRSPRADAAGRGGRGAGRRFPDADGDDALHQRGHDRDGGRFFAHGDRVRQHGRHSGRRRVDSRPERDRQERVRARLDRARLQPGGGRRDPGEIPRGPRAGGDGARN